MEAVTGACFEELLDFGDGAGERHHSGWEKHVRVWKRLSRCREMKREADADGGKRNMIERAP